MNEPKINRFGYIVITQAKDKRISTSSSEHSNILINPKIAGYYNPESYYKNEFP